MFKTFIGIDPGKQGYITAIGEDQEGRTAIESWAMPLIGKMIDIQTLGSVFKNISLFDSVHVAMEEVHAIYGASANNTWEFAYGVGIIEGLLTAYKIPYSKIAPKKWQSQMFEGVKMMTKPSSTGKTMKTDTKSMATVAAQRMFPEYDLKDTPRCKKPHDGKIDSLLIAEYCRRNFK